MEAETKKWIEKHIDKVVDKFRYGKLKVSDPEWCPCFKNDKCHAIGLADMNCFLCYCPHYENDKEEGGCKINNEKGGWHLSDKLTTGRIWDCSGCDWPHKEENIKKVLRKVYSIDGEN
ncbi:MAG: cysteine-rich small domain-containing protein [Nanoarchaeota archaeon]|nr:cysteine-rich small domain-containing protein [Nanoarchaeota archaeon]